MSRRKKAKKSTTILLAVVIFIGILAASLGIQLYMSPDFKGFTQEPQPDPIVTVLPGSDAQDGEQGNAPYNWEDHKIFIIGDSLTKGAQKEIEKVLPDATIDGKEGRNMAQGVQILQGWKDTGVLSDTAIVIVCLANNITGSTVNDAQTIVDMIEPGQSLIMMTGHGLREMAPANEFIRTLPNVYSFVTVADWDLTIAQSPALLSSDGIHIARNQGNVLYASLILRALEVAQPRP